MLETLLNSDFWIYVKRFCEIIATLSVIVEFTPCKLNPISFITSKLGDAFNSKIDGKLVSLKLDVENIDLRIKETKESLNNKIDANDAKQTERYILQIRGEILNFSNSCMNKVRHTKDEFDHIIEKHEEYEDLIKKSNMTNGRVELEFKYIEKIYFKCLEEDSFL